MAMLSTSEKIRRLYTEVVKGRSRMRIIQSKSVELESPPIFLIGPLRSGTTLSRYIIDSHSHICCPPETNFIGVLQELISKESSRIGLEAMGYDEEHVIAKLRELCVYFWGNYARAKGKPRWADKSTSHVDYITFIEDLFPEAQFVMIYRHGFDQTHSLTRGGTVLDKSIEPYHQSGEDPRIAAIRYWVDKTRKMLKFEERFPMKSIRIRYEDLCNEPKGELIRVFNFLQEPWEPAVLEFYKFEHDKGPEHGRTIATRGFSVSKDKYFSWPARIIEQCTKIAEPVLRTLGYTINCG